MKTIKLTKGKYTIVDDEDYEFLSQWKWFLSTGRAARNINKSDNVGRKRGIIFMHSVLMGGYTDHISRDPLDNRRSNLRLSTHQQNMCNIAPYNVGSKTSRYKGVSFCKTRKKWVGRIVSNGKYYMKRFNTELEAVLFYNEKSKELHKEYGYINEL